MSFSVFWNPKILFAGWPFKPSGYFIHHQVLTLKNSTFCPQSAFTCFAWISEQTAIVSLYSIDLQVFITNVQCLMRGTNWIIISNSNSSWSSNSSMCVKYFNSNYGPLQTLHQYVLPTYQPHGATSQKTTILTLTVVRIPNFTKSGIADILKNYYHT
jgi:hypothetical protein